jgi:hypothetical protein
LSTTLSKIWLSIGPFFTVLPITPSFLVRFRPVKYRIEALIALYTMVGGGGVSSIQLLVRSTVRSNLGQTRSTLVKLGQIWSKLSELWEIHSGPRFAVFWAWWTPVGLETARLNLGQPWKNLVGFWEMYPRPRFEVICRGGPSSDQAGLVRAASFCVSTPEKIPWVKMGL